MPLLTLENPPPFAAARPGRRMVRVGGLDGDAVAAARIVLDAVRWVKAEASEEEQTRWTVSAFPMAHRSPEGAGRPGGSPPRPAGSSTTRTGPRGSVPICLQNRLNEASGHGERSGRGGFSTELFARYQRSEKALVSALAEMYVQGVSTRKVKAITEELCGHTFSASTISRIDASLDGMLRHFAERKLDEAYPYLVLDARYEKVRLDGVIQTQAVLVAIGINWDGRTLVCLRSVGR